MHLLDINVWLALAFVAHQHHIAARLWFDALPEHEKCFFCRFTQQGFLRLATHRGAFPHFAVTQVEAWQIYDVFMVNPRIELADEPPRMETAWRQLTQLRQYAPQQWGDAYLAAYAASAGWEVVTFDQGFKQFAGVAVTILK